ncbi:uncharacterized protein LOC123263775 [Cotesia glomerata]|uniref:uncharacterized protein LOC123263775 n=1 Tax=Cotesia glomerata TaxID=32391 RepID=UPI001D01AA5F|nr:uncharacterized protein LOC123263775 [Cotesia glomerata]
MQYAIDFTGYYIADKEFILKEYCIVPLEGFKVGKHESYIVKPPYLFSKLSDHYKKAYLNIFYPKYGITWDDGYISNEEARESIIGKLVSADVIYLKHARKLNVLLKLLKHLIDPKKVVGLDKYGLNFSVEVSKPLCSHHQDPSNNRCVVKNALTCAYWVSKTFLPETSKSNVESWKNKTAKELMEIGRSDKIGQDEAFDDSDDSDSDEGPRRLVVNLNIVGEKKKSTDDNKELGSSSREDDSSELVDFDRDATESLSKDVDIKLEDNLSSSYGRLEEFDSEIDDSMTLAEMQKLFYDKNLDKKQAIVKLKKLDNSIFRKRYKFGKRLYLSELKL